MKHINLSISTALVLMKNSLSAADEHDEEGTEVLEMSDEDFMKAAESKLSVLEKNEDEPDQKEEEEVEEGDTEPEPDIESAGDAENDDSEIPQNQEQEDSADSEDNNETEEKQPEANTADSQQQEFDYKAEWDRLFGPIKASGRTIQLKNMDQVINRVQLAEDYHRKMASMRPHLKTIKTLEKAQLLGNDEELNFLLELKDRKPEAVKRLIAESGIDPMEIVDEEELSKSKEYRPGNYMVSDSEVAIDQAFEDISQSPAYNDTIDVLANRLDPKSKEIISEHPDYIKALNSDIENGLYDQIINEVNYQKEMGYIPQQLSDIEAYIGTVQYLAQQEMMAEQQKQQQQQNQPTPQQERPQNVRQRKSMKSPGGGSKRPKNKFDPIEILEMSDEDFMKEIGDSLR